MIQPSFKWQSFVFENNHSGECPLLVNKTNLGRYRCTPDKSALPCLKVPRQAILWMLIYRCLGPLIQYLETVKKFSLCAELQPLRVIHVLALVQSRFCQNFCGWLRTNQVGGTMNNNLSTRRFLL